MTFPQAMRSVFSKYAVFTGRASRSEFWWFMLLQAIITLGVSVIASAVTGDGSNSVVGLVQLGVFLALLVPGLAVLVRRLHDANYSGKYALLLLIPFIGGVFVLIFALLPSAPTGETADLPVALLETDPGSAPFISAP